MQGKGESSPSVALQQILRTPYISLRVRAAIKIYYSISVTILLSFALHVYFIHYVEGERKLEMQENRLFCEEWRVEHDRFSLWDDDKCDKSEEMTFSFFWY